MKHAHLKLYNELNDVVDSINFLEEPFALPINLRIPKATKRQQETGDNLFRDGSDITASRYNNAVITMQPRIVFDCAGEEASRKIESLRYRLDRMLETARRTSAMGYGPRVEFCEDTKGVTLVSEIIDGTFDIEEDWDWMNVAQGAVLNATLSLVRKPFRYSENYEKLENFVPNPGFEFVDTGVPAKWTAVNNSTFSTASTTSVEGDYSCYIINASGAGDALLKSSLFALTTGVKYYVEAWVCVLQGTVAGDLILEIIRNTGTATLTPTVSWIQGEILPEYDLSFLRIKDSQYWRRTPGSSDRQFIRKGYVFTATATDNFYVQFRVVAPATGGVYLIDRVYLTEAANLPVSLPTGTVLNPVVRTDIAPLFPKGWISDRAILNHWDDGTINHGDGNTDKYHHNWIDVYDIPGDVPAECKTRYENKSGGTVIRNIISALRSFGIPSSQSVVPETEYTGTADTACSQGAKEITGALGTSYVGSSPLLAGHEVNTGKNKTGNHHVLVRLKDVAAVQGNLRGRVEFALMNYNAHYYGMDITPPSAGAANWSVADLGVINIPEVKNLGYATTFDGMFIYTQWKRTTGADVVHLDCIFLLPADEFYAVASPTLNDTRFVNFNSIPGLPGCYQERYVSASDIRILEIPQQAVNLPYLAPIRQNRIWSITSLANGENILNQPMNVTVIYRSRWL